MSESAMAEKPLEDMDVTQSPEPEVETPAVEAAPEPEPEPVKATPVSLGRFGLQEHANQKWRLDVPIEVTPEQCLEEGFWTHVALHLKPGDEIRVFPDNMAWELVLHVIGAGKAYAHVAKKAFYPLATREDMVALPSIYKVDYAGTTHKWRILRDGKLLKDGFQTESIARRAAANHEAAVAR